MAQYSDSVSILKGIGKKKLDRLHAMGIDTLLDLIEHYPFRYMDKRMVFSSSDAGSDRSHLYEGTLIRKNLRLLGGRRTLLECTFRDRDGVFFASFFNMPYLNRTLQLERSYLLFGKMTWRNGAKLINSPEFYEPGSERDVRGILPVYRVTSGITSRELTKWIREALSILPDEEWLSEEILTVRRLAGESYKYRNLHFPESTAAYQAALFREQYDTLYTYMMAIELSRKRIDASESTRIEPVPMDPFYAALPFHLTAGQQEAIDDILRDLASPKPMNRLIQGDVGSGKTVVAEAGIYQVLQAGGQCAFMAPTEILARQHHQKLSLALSAFGFRTELLISGLKASERRRILSDLKEGTIHLLIGTHALIQEDVEFRNLALVITDEQHRFGVRQRRVLQDKSGDPNVLVMSATPIPRTLQATVFGDMDFSVIREKPSNRKTIITRSVNEEGRERAYAAVREQIRLGHRAYIVAPSIDADEENGLESVNRLYEEVSRRFPGIGTALLHGRMPKEEKESVMEDFRSGQVRILVSTVVIEVGIDVPEATIIVIENSERFGLAQLHQLRGRVGRNDLQSYCYLICYSRSENAAARMKAMVDFDSGFDISEEDFRLRGPGDLMGTMQHGAGMSGILALFSNEGLVQAVTEDVRTAVSLPVPERLLERIRHYDAADNSNVI